MTTLLGILTVMAGGFVGGTGAWPFKIMRKYQFEHWFFVGSFFGLIVMPWAVMLIGCPHALQSMADIPVAAVIKSNIFSFGWGIAAILCSLCFVRIGVALTGAILTGLGASLGAITPMVFKGSGLFSDAPALGSSAGLAVLGGVAVMLGGVALAALAGFGRDRELEKMQKLSGGFATGLVMTIVAGILSAFMPFAFVYGQGPIVASLSAVEPGDAVTVTVRGDPELSKLSGRYVIAADRTIEMPRLGKVAIDGNNAMAAARSVTAKIAAEEPGRASDVVVDTGSIPATFGVFAIGLFSGALVSIGYGAYFLFKNRSWGVLLHGGRDIAGALLLGANTCLAFALMGIGMLVLGVLGASVGAGVYLATQMFGNQFLGFVSGEWRGVHGSSRTQMYCAIALLMTAVVIMSYANTLSKT